MDEDSAFHGKFWHWACSSPCLLPRPEPPPPGSVPPRVTPGLAPHFRPAQQICPGLSLPICKVRSQTRYTSKSRPAEVLKAMALLWDRGGGCRGRLASSPPLRDSLPFPQPLLPGGCGSALPGRRRGLPLGAEGSEEASRGIECGREPGRTAEGELRGCCHQALSA